MDSTIGALALGIIIGWASACVWDVFWDLSQGKGASDGSTELGEQCESPGCAEDSYDGES